MQVSAMRHGSFGLTGLSKKAQPQQQVRFGETVWFQNGLDINPVTLKMDGDGKALAEKAIGVFEKVGMAMAESIGKVAESLKPYQSHMKDV